MTNNRCETVVGVEELEVCAVARRTPHEPFALDTPSAVVIIGAGWGAHLRCVEGDVSADGQRFFFSMIDAEAEKGTLRAILNWPSLLSKK